MIYVAIWAVEGTNYSLPSFYFPVVRVSKNKLFFDAQMTVHIVPNFSLNGSIHSHKINKKSIQWRRAVSYGLVDWRIQDDDG